MKHVTIPAQWLQELIALCGPEDHELRERVMKSAAPAPADALAISAQPYASGQEGDRVIFHFDDADQARAFYRATQTLQFGAIEPQARDAEITWPKARDVGRIGDMSQVAHIMEAWHSKPTPAAAAPAPQQSYVSISGELKPDVSVYSTQAAAPAGWKLVPIEPTAEMLESAGATDRDGTPATYKTLYMAMVGAALNPPPACDTPRYCNSVQRCTAMDEQRAAAAPVVLPEPAAWINQRCIVRDGECAGHEPQELNFNRHGDWDKSIALFTEPQVRALLAQAATTGVAAPASLGPALYSIDADPEGIRARVADAITGALAFGAQNSGKPPAGHWLAPFWMQARFGVIQFNALRDSAYALLNAPAADALAISDQPYASGQEGDKVIFHFDDADQARAFYRATQTLQFGAIAPQAQADAPGGDDTALIEWLSGRYISTDYHWGDPKTTVLVIEIPQNTSVCGDFRTDVREAMAIAAAKGNGQ